jgi:dihydroorotate dehydrogenase (fumarate)
LSTYLTLLPKVISASSHPSAQRTTKPFIISVTGSASKIRECYTQIQSAQSQIENPLLMEINLSCPNIPSKPPPAYSKESLIEYLQVLADVKKANSQGKEVAIGIKTPP